MIYFVVLFLFCARFVNSQTKSNILWATADKSVNVNDTVSLQCVVENKGLATLSWFKKVKGDEFVLIAAEESVFLHQGNSTHPKYSVSKEDEKYSLYIRNINDDDAGHYRCSLSSSGTETLSKQIRLTVLTPPSILENTTSPVTARVNGTTKLECYVSGTPSPKVIWTREGNNVLPSGSTTFEGSVLRIDRVRKEYAGIYYCTAQNEVKDVRKTFKLQVEFEPEVQVARKRVGQALQQRAELECKVAAFPEPQIVWFKDNNVIPPLEANVQRTKSALMNAITVSKIVITTVNRTQYGIYTCRAENTLGHAQESIEFYETSEVQCFPPTCGSSFDYPDFKLIFSTTCLLLLIFRW